MRIAEMGERIREERSRLGLTQASIADALQVSAQAVSKWERGENAPDVVIIPDLARLLGVSTDRLLGTTAPSQPTTRATVVFTDMKGFAKRVRAMSPHDMATLINAHFYEVTEVFLSYDAVPVKYLGDAFLSFFAGPGHEERALHAAVHARRLVSESISIGVNSGEIYVGRIGHPLHATLDIMGEAVNTAALAEKLSAETEASIVATEYTVGPVRDRFNLEEIDPGSPPRHDPATKFFCVSGVSG